MEFVERHQVTMLSGFPYLLAEMNHLPRNPGCLRLLISGGDVQRGVYVDRLLGQEEVYNTYGPSETTACTSYYRCNGGTVYQRGISGNTQVMIYGKRVEVMEVEARLYQCSGIEQAVVRAFTDEDGVSYMTAYIVPFEQDMRVPEFRKELSENLADIDLIYGV